MEAMADIAMTARVKAALIAELGADRVDVDTHLGAVRLNGPVRSEPIRAAAEDITRREGAYRVTNDLVVDAEETHGAGIAGLADLPAVDTPPGAPPARHASPEALEQAVRAALIEDDRVNEHLVTVQAEGDSVYLTGRQDTVQARDAAAEAAQRVPGTGYVWNDIEVEPSL